MQGAILFEEKQGYQQKRLRLFMLFCIGLAVIFLAARFFISDHTELRQAIFFLTAIAALALFIRSIKLHTVITTTGIYVRYFPFATRYTYINWANVKQCNIRQYSPLTEYGGWGIKMIVPENGWSYSFSGTTGLQIIFQDGTKLLIGTNRPEEITIILREAERLTVC